MFNKRKKITMKKKLFILTTLTTVNNSTGQTISSSTKTEYLVHCNWGWGGKANGYYASGVFKPKNGTVMTEPGVDFNFGSSNSNFWYGFHMITY